MLCHCAQDANRSVYFFRKTIADIDQSEFDGFEYVNPLLMSMEDCVWSAQKGHWTSPSVQLYMDRGVTRLVHLHGFAQTEALSDQSSFLAFHELKLPFSLFVQWTNLWSQDQHDIYLPISETVWRVNVVWCVFSSGERGGSAHQRCSDFELVNRPPTNMKALAAKRRSWSFVVKVSCVETIM